MNKNHLLFVGLLALSACQPTLNLPNDSENNKNLNSLITLTPGKNTIYLQDFVMNPADIDSITSSSKKLVCQIDSNKMTATFNANGTYS